MTMIERVARALCQQVHGFGGSESEISSAVDRFWTNHVSDARAAIEAMREPNEAMIPAGNIPMPALGQGITFNSADKVWRDMIDAALKDV